MITFRHHLLTLVAVFLALAVGIVLGGGPLSRVAESRTPTTTQPEGEPAAEARADYGDGFAAAVGPQLYADRLASQRVALVTFPGAEEGVVEDLVSRVEQAGGSVTGRYAFTQAMVAPGQKSLVDTLGSQLVAQGREDQVAEGATTYDRIGELLADAVATTGESGGEVSSAATGVVDGMVGAELLSAPDELEARAPLVLVVLGTPPDDEGAEAIVTGLVGGMARGARGLVVAGTTADGDGGQLAAVRDSAAAEQVTSLDGIDTVAGRVSSVLALARAAEERGGAFGASGSDGAVPLG